MANPSSALRVRRAVSRVEEASLELFRLAEQYRTVWTGYDAKHQRKALLEAAREYAAATRRLARLR